MKPWEEYESQPEQSDAKPWEQYASPDPEPQKEEKGFVDTIVDAGTNAVKAAFPAIAGGFAAYDAFGESLAERQRSGATAKDAAQDDGFLDRAGSLLERGVQSAYGGQARLAGSLGSDKFKERADALQDGASTAIAGETTWEQVKANPTAANIGSFITEQGISSLPEMIATVLPGGLAAQASVQTGRIGQDRAENDGRDEADLGDLTVGAAFGLPAAFLEKAGAGSVFNKIIGKQATTAIGGKIASNAAGRVGSAAATEGATEFAQSVLESVGGTLGTETGFDLASTLDEGLAGAVGGVGIGGGLSGGIEVVDGSGRLITNKLSGQRNVAAGAKEKAASSVQLTAEDESSPIPNDIIAQGKGTIAEAEGSSIADTILSRANMPKIGTTVKIDTGDGRIESGTIEDAFAEGDDRGLNIRLENGQLMRENFDDLAEAGVSITPASVEEAMLAKANAIDARVKAAAVQPLQTTPVTSVNINVDQNPASPSAGFALPVNGRITSKVGKRHAPKKGASTNHNGTDIAVPIGTPVNSPSAGKVIASGYTKKSGFFMRVDHGNGVITGYAHLNKKGLATGSEVKAGQVIAETGNSGNSTGPHLHYTMKVGGKTVDPLEYKAKAPAGIPATGEQQAADPELAADAAPTFQAANAQPIEVRTEDRQDVVTTANNRDVSVTYGVVDAASLKASNLPDGRVNPEYPPEMQPRDRSRSASQNQINNISQNMRPYWLGRTFRPDDGAPIISASGVVESGNGRSISIQNVYEQGGAKAEEYRKFVESQGIDTTGIENPVFVRVRNDDMTAEEARSFAREANMSTSLGMGTTEQSLADADSIPDDMMRLFQGGDIDLQANDPFVKAFMRDVLSPQELGNFTTNNGNISPEVYPRIRNAMLARAFGNNNLVRNLSSDFTGNLAGVTNALGDIAGQWSQMLSQISASEVHAEYDITANLNEAVEIVERSRRQKLKVADIVNQKSLLSGDNISQETEMLLRLFFQKPDFTRPASRARILEGLKTYIETAQNDRADQDSMFGDSGEPDVTSALYQSRVKQGYAKEDNPDAPERNSEVKPAKQGEQESPARSGQDAPKSSGNGKEPTGESLPQDAGQEGSFDLDSPTVSKKETAADPDPKPVDKTPEKSPPAAEEAVAPEKVGSKSSRPLYSPENDAIPLDSTKTGDLWTLGDVELEALEEKLKVAEEENIRRAFNDDKAYQEWKSIRPRSKRENALNDIEFDEKAAMLVFGLSSDPRATSEDVAEIIRSVGYVDPSDSQSQIIGEMVSSISRMDKLTIDRVIAGEALAIEQARFISFRNGAAALKIQGVEQSKIPGLLVKEYQRLGIELGDAVFMVSKIFGETIKTSTSGLSITGKSTDKKALPKPNPKAESKPVVKTPEKSPPVSEEAVAPEKVDKPSSNIPTKLTLVVGSKNIAFNGDYERASRAFLETISQLGIGSSQTPSGKIKNDNGETVAYISYNGRVFAGSPELWTPETELLFDPRTVDGNEKLFSKVTPGLNNSQLESKTEDKPAKTEPAGEKIGDFGEELLGARKHYAESYRDSMSAAKDLDLASEPFSKTWPAPDYQKLIDDGVEPFVVAFIRALRESMPSKPRKGWKLAGWVQTVEQFRALSNASINGNWTKESLQSKLDEPKFIRSLSGFRGLVDLYDAVGHEQSLKGLSFRLGRYSIWKGETHNPPIMIWTVNRDRKSGSMRILAEGKTKEEAIAKFKTAQSSGVLDKAVDRKIKFSVYSYRSKPGVFIIGKKIGKNHADLKEFADRKEARDYLENNYDDLVTALNKYKDIPNIRADENGLRIGTDHRNGGDVSPEQFQEAFGFRGVQFGNYVEGPRRQEDLNQAYDALLDMSELLDIPAKSISLNGSLGLAFGARGKGGKNSGVAHFEPDNVVINLTKRAGAGSLAHEWWHSLDNYFSKAGNSVHGYGTEGFRYDQTGVRPEMVEAFGNVAKAIKKTAIKERSGKLDKKRTKAYWATGREMTARAFESHVIAKLADQGYSNDYLANVVDEKAWGLEGEYPYATASEIPTVTAAYDGFFNTIETRETETGVELYSIPASAADGTDSFFGDATTDDKRTALEREGEGRIKSKAKQKPPGSDGGLFDDNSGSQQELFSVITADTKAFGVDLRAQFDKLGLKNKISLRTAASFTNGLQAGRYVPALKLIEVANHPDQSQNFTLNHEAIHALRDLDLFRPAEWKALVRRAKGDAALMASIKERYGSETTEIQTEEAVADLFASWSQGKKERGFVQDALERVLEFISSLSSALKGMGFVSAGGVMRDIESGKVGRRESRNNIPKDIPAYASIANPLGRERVEVDSSTLPDHISSGMDAVRKLGPKNPKMGEALEKMRIMFQDRMLPVLRLQNGLSATLGRDIAESENAYLGEELMSGRVGARLENLYDESINPLFEKMAAEDVSLDELESYLYARHAPERNARISEINPDFEEGTGSGMSDIQAKAIMSRIVKSGKMEKMQRLSITVDKMLSESVETRVEAGLMSAEEAAAWGENYEYYVPLRGNSEVDAADFTGFANKISAQSGVSVKGKESRRAFGRRSRAESIVGYSILQAEEAISRSETNKVAKSFYDLTQASPDSKLWTINKVERRPSFNDKTGQVQYRNESRISAEDAPFTVSVKIKGEEHRITLDRTNKEAVKIADSMRNLTSVQFEFMTKTVGRFTRAFSQINTRFSPPFIVTNAVRDIMTAAVILKQYDEPGLVKDVLRDWRKALLAPKNQKEEWGRWRREFELSGGKVYFNQQGDLDAIREEVHKKIERAKNPVGAKIAWKKFFDGVDLVNDAVERAVRLSVYKNMRERGRTKADSASVARNVTVNFTRKGQLGPLINSMFAFFNAGTQGSANLIMAAIKSKKVRHAMGGFIIAGFILDMLNSLIAGDDDDGENLWDKLPEYQKSKNVILMMPDGSGNTIKLPLAYGLNSLFGLGANLSSIVRGKKTAGDASIDSLISFAEAFNPLGSGGTALNIITPTALDPVLDLTANKDFTGRAIVPEPSPFSPEPTPSSNYYASVNTAAKWFTSGLNSATGGDDVVPGAVSISPEVVEYLAGYFTGGAGRFVSDVGGIALAPLDPEKEITVNDIPMVDRIIGTKSPWLNKSLFYERVREVESVTTHAKEYIDREDWESFDSYVGKKTKIVDMESETKAARKEMRAIRKAKVENERLHNLKKIDTDFYRSEKEVFKEAESLVVTQYNTVWNKVMSPSSSDN